MNGADIRLGGTPADFIKMTLHDVEGAANNSTVIRTDSGIKTLTAAHVDTRHGLIAAPSLQSLNITGDKKVNLAGDIRSTQIQLSGQGITAKHNSLNKVTVSHAIVDSIFSVIVGLGGIGSITAGLMVDSGIKAGYTPNGNGNLDQWMNGGVFGPPLLIKSVIIKGVKNEAGPAFSQSVIAASTIKSVFVKSLKLERLPGRLRACLPTSPLRAWPTARNSSTIFPTDPPTRPQTHRPAFT